MPYVEEEEDEESNVLRKEQVGELIKNCSRIDRPIIVMYFYFGCRRMELPTFKNHLDDLDPEEGTARFDVLKHRKKKRTKLLYYDDWVAEIFRQWEEGNLRLEFSSDSYYKKVSKYKEELGVEQLNPTTGRRTFNTHMRDILDDDPLVKSLTGHKFDQSMTDHYDVSFETMRKRAMTEDHYFNDIDLPVSPV
jgi:integrase